jgi:hypothetical protein
MKSQVIWLSAGSVLAVVIVVVAVLWLMRPQVLELKDGTKLTFVSVTHGRHHVPPKIKISGGRNRGGGGPIDTTNDSIVVWIESETKKKGPNQWPNSQLFVYDSAETACANSWPRSTSQIKDGVYLQGFLLDAFPRRDSKMLLRVGGWNNVGNGFQVAKGQFVISNPARVKTYSKWAEDALPDTQSDGDLNVTLTKLVYGMPGFNSGTGASSKDPMNKAVLADFHCEQKGVTVTNWQVMQIETSDATGNHSQLRSWSTSRDSDGDATMTYQYGLWPAESPWKLRVEMSRTSGFNDDEQWAVANVPVQPGKWNDLWNNSGGRNSRSDPPFSETTLNGIHVKLFPAILASDQNSGGMHQGGIRVETEPEVPPGYRLSILASDEQGRPLQGWGPNGGNNNYVEQLPDLRARTLSVIVALHKSRFVEFTVKPVKQ